MSSFFLNFYKKNQKILTLLSRIDYILTKTEIYYNMFMALKTYGGVTSMKIDEINKKMIKKLRQGRKSFGEIAKELSITPNTVKARVKKMIENGILDIVGVIDPEKIENHFLAIIGVKLRNMNLVKKGEEFSKLKGVVSVGIVTGQFDLILIVLLNDDFSLLEFLTKEVSKIKEVSATETFVVYKTFNLKVPYIL